MLPNMNLSEARSESIKPGGYIMRILAVEIDEKYNRLKLKCDIASGPMEGYYKRLEDRAGFWGMYVSMYMDEKSRWKFARTIDAIKESNPDFEWDYDGQNDEQKLVNNLIGVVTRIKYYTGNDGQEKSKIVPYATVSVTDIKTDNFKVPDPITQYDDAPVGGVVDTTSGGFEDLRTDDMPF